MIRDAQSVSSPIVDVPGSQHQGLRLIRAVYFFQFGAIGVIFPFLNLYYRELGLSGVQIGVIASLSPLVAMVAGPLWGMFSDRTGQTRLLLILAASGAIGTVAVLSTVHSYAAIVVLMALFAFFANPIHPLVDSTALQLLGGRRETYGRLRLWGSLGYVATTWGFGQLLVRAGLHWLFLGYIVFMAIVPLLATRLPVQRPPFQRPLRAGMLELTRQRQWLLFMISLIVLGLTNSGANQFLSIYIKDLGGDEGLIGTAAAVSGLSEVPIMFMAAGLLARWGSRRVLMLAYALFSVRWALYGFMSDPSWAIGISLLHGPTFGALWVAGVGYADRLAPDDLKATAQALFTAAFFSISSVIGAPLSGVLYDSIGPAMLFRLYAIVGVLALALLAQARG